MQYTNQHQPEKVQFQTISFLANLADDEAEKVNGGRWKEEKAYDPPKPADPNSGAGHWNPYDGNLLNQPDDDG
ncbi:MAG: hypothetical protein HC851_23065 [Acaryochloris sp. RU_4_1]|nr:hypothetical protein [Acaryochloris sp. RU_4_1]NJR57066.1 hypothetical protein [Acaryochloris sp. CRU_2_0]